MKKVCLLLGAALLSTSAFAATRVLYSQDFETASDVAATGWTYGGGSISIASDDFGKFLELSLGQNNGRSGYVKWGEEIYQNADGECVLEDGTYTVKFDFAIKTNSNNQYNSEITLFTNGSGNSNQPWRGRYNGDYSSSCSWLADILQTNTSADTDMLAVINAPLEESITTGDDGTETVSYAVNKTDDEKTISTGTWYTFTSNVNVNTREVEYTVLSNMGEELASGSFTVPETSVYSEEPYDISMFAQGLWVMTARYGTTILFDNFEVSFESAYDYANPPTIALVGLGKVYDEAAEDDVLNLNARTYTVTFKAGETLHVEAPGLEPAEVEYDDCDGAYQFTITTSGTIKAYTVSGDATSDLVEVEADCDPVVLPAAEATISAVEAGYGKTYTLSVSNTEVPLRPTIFINYKYVDKNGNVVWDVEGVASGATVTVAEEGTLTLTTQAFGYQETTTSVENELEFEVKSEWDFARMSQDELTAAGFSTWNEKNSTSTSGFDNWTARKRLFYYDATSATVNDEGETEYTAVYPFGYVSEDGPVLYYSEIDTEGSVETNVAGYELFPGVTVFAGHNVTALLHVGVTNNATSGGNYKNIDVLNLAQTDFVVYNTIGSYGSDSNHPVVETVEEYYAELAGTNNVVRAADGTANEDGTYTVSCPIYRIDTVCTNVTVFAQVGASSAVEAIEAAPAQVVEDGKWYNLQGIQVAEPTSNGIYIHNGKKVMIRK